MIGLLFGLQLYVNNIVATSFFEIQFLFDNFVFTSLVTFSSACLILGNNILMLID
jgi:hypothetical protein